jgi:hypothetical protein
MKKRSPKEWGFSVKPGPGTRLPSGWHIDTGILRYCGVTINCSEVFASVPSILTMK